MDPREQEQYEAQWGPDWEEQLKLMCELLSEEELPSTSSWIKTDEQQEAIAALEMTARALQDVTQDVYAWRWVIISLHIATQGFMVVALRDSAGLIPLQDKFAAEWREAYRQGKPVPEEEKLDSYRNLYKKVKNKRIAKILNATPFKPTGSQGRSINLLCNLRDQFVHFLPRLWTLEVAGLPLMCRDVFNFIEFLCKEYRSMPIMVWHNEEQPRRIDEALSRARKTLQQIPVSRLGGVNKQ